MRQPKGLCAFCERLGAERDAYTTVDYVPICDFHIARVKEGAELMDIQWRSMAKNYWVPLLEAANMRCKTCNREADKLDLLFTQMHQESQEEWFCQKACWEAYEQKKEGE